MVLVPNSIDKCIIAAWLSANPHPPALMYLHSMGLYNLQILLLPFSMNLP
jgi:hypothetical protein